MTINRMLEAIKKVDTKFKKLMSSHWKHHPGSDIECVYLKSKNIGKDLIQIELTNIITIIECKKYFDTIWMLKLVNTHD